MDIFDFPRDSSELRKLFSAPPSRYKPFPFYIMDGDISGEEIAAGLAARLKKFGCGGCVMLPSDTVSPKYGSDEYFACCRAMLDRLRKNSLFAIYSDSVIPSRIPAGQTEPAETGDPDISSPDEADDRLDTEVSGRGSAAEAPFSDAFCARELIMREYECSSGEIFARNLDASGTTMSVGAYNIDTHEFIDLRSSVTDGRIEWPVPEGNWNLLQFICRPVSESGYVNYLSYEACRAFTDRTYKRIVSEYGDHIGDTLFMAYYNGIQYAGRNRRMWDESFNDVFKSEFGFDPAPFYPALFMDIGENTAHLKALMFECRGRMLQDGFFKAVSDFARTSGIISSGCVADPKTTQAAWIFGDGMMYQKTSGAAAVSLTNGAGYGFNGLKLASGAADCFDKSIVICDVFGNYKNLSLASMYRSGMTALARGVNFIMPRIPYSAAENLGVSAFYDFVSRAQVMLRGGRHICDIAVLYPIHSLEAQAYLYDAQADGFEYPQTPENADYMDIVNLITDYTLRDLTILHPETLSENCFADGGELKLVSDSNPQSFKLLVMPGSSLISVKALRAAARFYDQGGKIIATTELPSQAFEFNPDGDTGGGYDDEVKELITHIFGVTMDRVNAFNDYYHNENGKGGEAYFIPPSLTAADGTDIVDKDLLDNILNRLLPDCDVMFDEAPKSSDNGVFGLSLPAFRAMDHSLEAINSGKVFNYIHKNLAGCDIYYIANATASDFTGVMSVISEKPVIEEWNPYTGRIRRVQQDEITRADGRTAVRCDIRSGSSVFIVFRDESRPALSLNSLFKSMEQ